jgi:hypothetical protein
LELFLTKAHRTYGTRSQVHRGIINNLALKGRGIKPSPRIKAKSPWKKPKFRIKRRSEMFTSLENYAIIRRQRWNDYGNRYIPERSFLKIF